MSFEYIYNFIYMLLDMFSELGYLILDFVNTNIVIGGTSYPLIVVMFGGGLVVFLIIKLVV